MILWIFIFCLLGRPARRPSNTVLWLRDLAPGENKNMVSSERWCFRALKPVAIGLRPGRYIPKQPAFRSHPPELGDIDDFLVFAILAPWPTNCSEQLAGWRHGLVAVGFGSGK